jgi:hypothetical protein
MDLISLQTFISEYINRTDLQPEDMNTSTIMTFASPAVQKFQVDKLCNHIVTLIRVENYNAPLPKNFCKIVEAAYKPTEYKKYDRLMYRDEVVSWTGKNFAGCDVKISVDCPKCHQHTCSCGDDSVLIKVDDDWLMANVERQYWDNPRYLGVYGLNKQSCSIYHPEFELIRPAQHKFFGADYHVRGCVNLDTRLLGQAPAEYRIENKHMRINAETGLILLAYLAYQTDDKGYPLIPDDTDVFEAIFWEVEYKMLYKYKRKAKENYQLAMNAKQLAETHMRRALEKVNQKTPLEWYAIIRNHFKQIPYRNVDSQASRVLADRFDEFVRRR